MTNRFFSFDNNVGWFDEFWAIGGDVVGVNLSPSETSFIVLQVLPFWVAEFGSDSELTTRGWGIGVGVASQFFRN